MVFVIHGAIMATCTARVVAAFIAMGLEPEKDFKVEAADMSKLKIPEWLAHQPFGQIPYLVDTETGAEVCESRAIIRYVAAKIKSPLAPGPDDLLAYAKYEQGAQHELTQWAPCTDALSAQLVFTRLRGGEMDQAIVAAQKETLHVKLQGYERLLSKQAYIGGDKLTLVDLAHLPYGNIVDYMGAAPQLRDGSLPNVARWWKQVIEHPAWAKTKELGHQDFLHLRV